MGIALLNKVYKMAAAAFYQTGQEIGSSLEEQPLIYVSDTLTALQQLAKAYLNYVQPKVIAVTGSNGKTTTKDMIESVLKHSLK